MKKKRSALFTSILALLLCVSMLVGTTFAWFTDSVSTGINQIAAGTLDVELYHSNAVATDEQVDSNTKLFMDLKGEPILWEPGVVSYENLRVSNAGDLALAYQLSINTANENFVLDPANNAQYGLSQILKVGVVEGGITATDRAGVVAAVGANWIGLNDFLRSGSLLPEGAGTSEQTWGVVIYWEPGENDNLWNLNNGKQLSSGDVLSIDLGVSLIATQEQHESDSFGNDYDSSAKADFFPNFVGGSASATVTPNGQNQTADQVTMSAGAVAATVPAGVQLADGTTELLLSVSSMDASGANITLEQGEDMRSLDVHIEGVAPTNTVPMTITIAEAAPTGLNMGNYKLYHVENGTANEMTYVASGADFTAHNQFKYDPATGDITLYMATFSEVTVIANQLNPWNGDLDYSWYNTTDTSFEIANADQLAGFGAIVGGMASGIEQDSFSGKTVKLIADINLGDDEENNVEGKIFYPIGYYYTDDKNADGTTGDYYSTVYSFEGTFDGTGHTISNFYQNTWEMKGDYDGNYYKDGMGLFGYVNGGTVKNLTVDNFSSDGEFTPTGVIAAYAAGDATFENIAITNCNPRVYNTGNGGIIGIAGSTSAADDDHIALKNITVDNSNKISALWGSWDVACGGLVGMYRGNVNGNGEATKDTISFTNCHVAAQIDVYNDVCANYQYYAYRYAGMIIGSIRHNTKNADGKTIPNMTGISASGCTVNYGDWNDYYYCELVDNSIASYTHDYQFSRLEKVDTLPETAEGTKHYYVKNEDGSITCRHFIDGNLHNHCYTDTNGKAYYYYIGYWCAQGNQGVESSSGGCVTPDTLVTLADGTQKRIDEVTYADELLAWNFYAGVHEVIPAALLINHGADTCNILKLQFSDGTSIKTIVNHGFFDMTLNEFVFIDEGNVKQYVGHEFVRQDGNGYSTVKLVGYSIRQEYTEIYSILTAVHYNCFLEGMLTLTPPDVNGNFFIPFELGDNLKYDEETMQADIEKYGLYIYEEFAHLMTEEQFEALNIAQIKVAVGKNIITHEELIMLISKYLG